MSTESQRARAVKLVEAGATYLDAGAIARHFDLARSYVDRLRKEAAA